MFRSAKRRRVEPSDPHEVELRELAKVLDRVAESPKGRSQGADFSCGGVMPALSNPGLYIQSYGHVSLPVTGTEGPPTKLLELFEKAPFGKGEETVYDATVRNTYQMAPEHFELRNPRCLPAVHELAQTKIAEVMGFPPERVEVKPYKILLYEKGCFFKKHRDTQKFLGISDRWGVTVEMPMIFVRIGVS